MTIKVSEDLTSFFQNGSKVKDVLAIGIGSAGCRILSQIKRTNTVINRFVAISLDESDVRGISADETLLIPSMPHGKISPSYVRALALNHISEIKEIVGEPNFAFIICGLGGGAGSALAPLVAEIAKEKSAMTVGVAVMPYKFESNKHFYAGMALKRLHRCTHAVIVIDNEGFAEHAPEMPILDSYALINERISLALDKITSCSNEKEFTVGLNKLAYTLNQEGFSILTVFSSTSLDKAEEALAGAVQGIYRVAEPNEASRAILHLVGDVKLSTNDIATSARRLNDLMGGSLEVNHGFSANSNTQQLTAIVVVSGFKTTKFDNYDPVAAILDEQWQIDDSAECAIDIEMPRLQSMD